VAARLAENVVALPVSTYLLDVPDYQFRKVTEFTDYSQELFRLGIFCCGGTTERVGWFGFIVQSTWRDISGATGVDGLAWEASASTAALPSGSSPFREPSP
jgi:hypothetical protein